MSKIIMNITHFPVDLVIIFDYLLRYEYNR